MRKPRKTFRLGREVYEMFKSWKRPGESFSDVLIRKCEEYEKRHSLRTRGSCPGGYK